MHPILSRPDRAWIIYASSGPIGVLLATLPLMQAGAEGGEAGLFGLWGAMMMFFAVKSWHIARFVPKKRGNETDATGTKRAMCHDFSAKNIMTAPQAPNSPASTASAPARRNGSVASRAPTAPQDA